MNLFSIFLQQIAFDQQFACSRHHQQSLFDNLGTHYVSLHGKNEGPENSLLERATKLNEPLRQQAFAISTRSTILKSLVISQ